MNIDSLLVRLGAPALLSCAVLSPFTQAPIVGAEAAMHREAAPQGERRPAWLDGNTQPSVEAKTAAPIADDNLETVRERYENGAVMVERQVALDEDGDFVNHGAYQHFSPKGRVLRQGQFDRGLMEGNWERVFNAGEGSLFSGDYDAYFKGPYLSQAHFHEGKLDGAWTITDRFGHKIIEWQFENGVRTGPSTWFYPNGQMRRQVDYRNDLEEGMLTEWRSDGRKIRSVPVGGGRLRMAVSWHSPGHKAAEGPRYVERQEVTAAYDWWNGTVSIQLVGEAKPDPMHGVWTFYHPNGQRLMVGEYDDDVPVGRFTWWHANGVKQAEGVYDQGQREGQWMSWHQNGRRESQGQFANNVEVGEWTRWAVDGSVEAVDEHGRTNGRLSDTLQAPEDPFAMDVPSPASKRSSQARRLTRQEPARHDTANDEEAVANGEEDADDDGDVSDARVPTFSTARPYGHRPAPSATMDDGPILGEPTPAIR